MAVVFEHMIKHVLRMKIAMLLALGFVRPLLGSSSSHDRGVVCMACLTVSVPCPQATVE